MALVRALALEVGEKSAEIDAAPEALPATEGLLLALQVLETLKLCESVPLLQAV